VPLLWCFRPLPALIPADPVSTSSPHLCTLGQAARQRRRRCGKRLGTSVVHTMDSSDDVWIKDADMRPDMQQTAISIARAVRWRVGGCVRRRRWRRRAGVDWRWIASWGFVLLKHRHRWRSSWFYCGACRRDVSRIRGLGRSLDIDSIACRLLLVLGCLLLLNALFPHHPLFLFAPLREYPQAIYKRQLDEKAVAGLLQEEFDSRYGGPWHCIVGRYVGGDVDWLRRLPRMGERVACRDRVTMLNHRRTLHIVGGLSPRCQSPRPRCRRILGFLIL